MSNRAFYSGTQAQLADGATQLVTVVTPSPSSFGVPAAQLASFTTLKNSFVSLLNQSSQPTSNTRAVNTAKNTARRALRQAAVLIAKVITGTPSVTDEQLVSLNLLPRTRGPAVPMTRVAPIVNLLSCAGRIAKILVKDPSEQSRRGKTRGAVGINIFTYVGPQMPDNVEDYFFQGMTTRTTSEVQFSNSVPSGSLVWISVCWVGRRGELSAASTPISFTVQGGGVAAREVQQPNSARLAA